MADKFCQSSGAGEGFYTVHGPVQARASLHLLALGPGPQGSGQASRPLAPGQLGPGPLGPGQGRARVGPGPHPLFFSFLFLESTFPVCESAAIILCPDKSLYSTHDNSVMQVPHGNNLCNIFASPGSRNSFYHHHPPCFCFIWGLREGMRGLQAECRTRDGQHQGVLPLLPNVIRNASGHMDARASMWFDWWVVELSDWLRYWWCGLGMRGARPAPSQAGRDRSHRTASHERHDS